MKGVLLAVIAVGFVLIGPVMFVLSREYALESAFARIRPGETEAEVRAVLGRPERQVRRRVASSRSDLEYRYTVWPFSGAWVVEFAGGRVVAARRR